MDYEYVYKTLFPIKDNARFFHLKFVPMRYCYKAEASQKCEREIHQPILLEQSNKGLFKVIIHYKAHNVSYIFHKLH